jgi:hypothetical protein
MIETTKKLKNSTKFYAQYDVENNKSVLSREILKDGTEIIYPFDKEGKQSYKYLQKIIFKDVGRGSVKGFYTLNFGYGLTRNLSPLLKVLETDTFLTKELQIVSKGSISFDKKKGVFVLPKDDLEFLFDSIRPTRDHHSKELKLIVENYLKNKGVLKGAVSPLYVTGSLKKLVKELTEGKVKLSKIDVEALKTLNELESAELVEAEKKFIVSTKEKVESIYFEAVIEEFDKLLKQSSESETLEKKWHEFFKKYPWIFTYLFATSVSYFDDQYYVGGQKGSGSGAQYADFIYKNQLTENNAIIEIKTHATKLLNKSPYRKGTNVYAPSFPLAGSINQVLSQKDTLLKEFNSIVGTDFKSYEPKCVVVIGTLKSLSPEEKRSFEMFRNNLKGVEVVSFDELRQKVNIINKLFEKQK